MRALGFGALFAIVACGPKSEPREAHTYQVEIRGMQFVPASLHVERGDLVVWKNSDLVPHTVTSPGFFDSGPLQPGAKWTWAVTQNGVQLDYVCTMHPTMKAALIVQ